MNTDRASCFLWLIVALALSCVSIGTVAAQLRSCVGDCNGDCRVGIDELLGGVCLHVSGGGFWCRSCDALDANCDGAIAVNELIQGVNNLLRGCPADCVPGSWSCAPTTPSPTATPTATPTQPPPDPLWGMIAGLLEAQVDCGTVYVGPISDSGAAIYCPWGPGHDSRLSLTRKADDGDAAAAVEEFSENGGEIELFGGPAYLWERQFPSGSLEHNYRYLKAQLGCWFIAAQSFDDTSFRLAYHPLPMAKIVIEEFGDELLRRCD